MDESLFFTGRSVRSERQKAMNEKASLFSEEKSKGTSVSLLSRAEINEWRDCSPDVRTGTACKCGTHSSAAWTDGGAEWFEGHVLEHHVSERAKMAQIAMTTPILPATQDNYSPLEVMGLLGDQRIAIANRILGR